MRTVVPVRRTSSGFTLIELLIVCVIIMTMTALSAPLFRKTFSDLQLRGSASAITKQVTLAQQQAVATEASCRALFNFDKGSYQFGKVYKLPAGIKMEGSAKEINFYPDGHSDRVEVTLSGKNGKKLKIAITGVLGGTVVSEEK